MGGRPAALGALVARRGAGYRLAAVPAGAPPGRVRFAVAPRAAPAARGGMTPRRTPAALADAERDRLPQGIPKWRSEGGELRSMPSVLPDLRRWGTPRPPGFVSVGPKNSMEIGLGSEKVLVVWWACASTRFG
nr:unnamed protein product [Digitaria exilis]